MHFLQSLLRSEAGLLLKDVYKRQFAGCMLTGTLVLPSTLLDLGASAFENCTGLTGNINIPAGVTEIKNNTFAGLSLIHIYSYTAIWFDFHWC